jgi:hypothetical protein
MLLGHRGAWSFVPRKHAAGLRKIQKRRYKASGVRCFAAKDVAYNRGLIQTDTPMDASLGAVNFRFHGSAPRD